MIWMGTRRPIHLLACAASYGHGTGPCIAWPDLAVSLDRENRRMYALWPFWRRERGTAGLLLIGRPPPPTMRAHAPSSFPHRRIARIYRLSSHRYSGSADPFRRRPGPRFGSQSLPNVTASICRRRRKTQACPCTHLHHHHHHQLLHHPHPNTHHVLPAPAPRHLLPCLVVRPSYPPGSRRQPASNSVKRAQCLVTMAGLPCMAPSSPSPRSLDVRPHGRPSGHVPSCSANV